jgi:hypothetical protein
MTSNSVKENVEELTSGDLSNPHLELTPAQISEIELDIAGPHVYAYEMYEGSNYLIK